MLLAAVAALAPIVGGSADPGDPAVPVLYVVEGDAAFICTGTLVSPRVIVTAAHCVNFAGAPPSIFEAHFVANLDDPADATNTRTVVSWQYDTAFDENHADAGHDIGIVLLDAPAPVAPIPFNDAALAVGQPLRLVGFGTTLLDHDDAGLRRMATSTIAEVSDQLFDFSGAQGICIGDSGGPAFATIDGVDKLVGIHSFGDCSTEGATSGWDTRVDRYAASFIAPFIAANDPANDSGPDPATEPGGCASGHASGLGGVALVLLAVRRRARPSRP